MVNTLADNASAPVVQPKATRPRGSFWLAANSVALVAAALAMRAWRLGNIPGINGDEAWYGVQALALVHGGTVDWWTPTGNPINVFFMFPLAALHAVFGPSFALLRAVALASGVLALVANYWLCRRVFDARTALVSTLLLALLPINIAYSRFAWDTSQSLLATLLVLYLPLWHYRGRRDAASLPVAGMVALAAAMLVHPTNIFAAPLVAVPIAYAWRHKAWRKSQAVAVPAKTWTLAGLATGSIIVAYLAWLALWGAAVRLRGPDEFLAFAQNYLKLFSGATVYEYICGVDQATGALAWFAFLPVVCKVLFGIAVVCGVFGMMRRLAAESGDDDICLVLGWGIMLAGFFVVAGPDAVAPHLERYGICLIAPGAVVLARGWAWWLEPGQSRARAATWSLAMAAWLFPATFYLGYFDFIERTGGRSHLAFRTAAVEPKLAALRYVSARRKAGRATRIVAGEWWNYWPLAYLAGSANELRVVSGQPWQGETQTQQPPGSKESESTWYVEFADSPADQEVLGRAGQSGKRVERHLVCDYSGQPLLSVVGPAE
ncbi:MAG: glycosyltransferase family 39 protein [Pirellulales bacterium]